jgi:hypothetical protein
VRASGIFRTLELLVDLQVSSSKKELKLGPQCKVPILKALTRAVAKIVSTRRAMPMPQ